MKLFALSRHAQQPLAALIPLRLAKSIVYRNKEQNPACKGVKASGLAAAHVEGLAPTPTVGNASSVLVAGGAFTLVDSSPVPPRPVLARVPRHAHSAPQAAELAARMWVASGDPLIERRGTTIGHGAEVGGERAPRCPRVG